MSFEQQWDLPRRDLREVFDAVLEVADDHGLRFWGWSTEPSSIRVTVQFPVDEAAELAVAMSDLYDAVESAAEELDPLNGEIDMDAAEAAGVVDVKTVGSTVIKSLPIEHEESFTGPAPTHYTCSFEINWTCSPSMSVSSNEDHNRAGWPAILSFTDAVVERLGGVWFTD